MADLIGEDTYMYKQQLQCCFSINVAQNWYDIPMIYHLRYERHIGTSAFISSISYLLSIQLSLVVFR